MKQLTYVLKQTAHLRTMRGLDQRKNLYHGSHCVYLFQPLSTGYFMDILNQNPSTLRRVSCYISWIGIAFMLTTSKFLSQIVLLVLQRSCV